MNNNKIDYNRFIQSNDKISSSSKNQRTTIAPKNQYEFSFNKKDSIYDYYSGGKEFNTQTQKLQRKQFATSKQQMVYKTNHKSQIQQSLTQVRKRLFNRQNVNEKSEEIQQLLNKKIRNERQPENLQLKLISSQFKKKMHNYQRIFNQVSQNQHKTQQKKKRQPWTASNTFQNMNTTYLSNKKNNNDVSQNNQNNFNLANILPQKPKKTQHDKILLQLHRQIDQTNRINSEKNQNYLISRQNQRNYIKKKIFQSNSDLIKNYEDLQNNVQYQYRKIKFFQKFIGSNI